MVPSLQFTECSVLILEKLYFQLTPDAHLGEATQRARMILRVLDSAHVLTGMETAPSSRPQTPWPFTHQNTGLRSTHRPAVRGWPLGGGLLPHVC